MVEMIATRRRAYSERRPGASPSYARALPSAIRTTVTST